MSNGSRKTKYFVFNKNLDFTRGGKTNIKLIDDAEVNTGIEIDDLSKGTGYFMSRVLDSREKNTKWHRMVVEGDTISEASVQFTIYVSEESYLVYKGKVVEIEDMIQDKLLTIEEKRRIFSDYKVKEYKDPKDVLMHSIEGRYLWFDIKLVAQGNISPVINKIKVYFPKETWLSYLPEIYQQDEKSASFIERFLGMFQSIYDDMTSEIETISKYFDPDSVTGEFVEWLGTWLAIEDGFIWDEEQMKYLVKNGVKLYKMRGTIEYLKEMVKLYTKKEPYIVEYHKIQPYINNKSFHDRIAGLYSDNNYVFSIIIDVEKQISNKEYQILTRIINHAKPAHVGCNVIVLERYIFLDKHSYLGINTVLGNYNAFVLDGQSSIPFTTISSNDLSNAHYTDGYMI